MSAVWVAKSMRRLGRRSAKAPAGMEKKSMGANCRALMTPSLKAESVSSRTSQAWATLCIQVPTRETSWPARKSRKSRCCSERRPWG